LTDIQCKNTTRYSQQHEQAAEYGHRLQLTAVFYVNLHELVPRHFLLPLVLKENLAVHWAPELVFTEDKLIVFTTLRKPFHY